MHGIDFRLNHLRAIFLKIDISFVQSEFQMKVANVIAPGTRIILVRRPLYCRIFDTFVSATILLFFIFSRKKIAIYDHRNPLVLIAAVLCKWFPCYFGQVYIGDDGLHSLMVDRYKNRFLYWQTKPLKAYLIKKFEKQVLEFKRSHAIKDMREYSAAGSLFFDFYGNLEKSQTSTQIGSAIFIDAPAVLNCMQLNEINELTDMLSMYNRIEIILHPRRKDVSFYEKLGFATRLSPNIESELRTLDKTVEVIGYFSTVLLAGKYYNHKIKVLDMPICTNREFKEYANAGLKIIYD